MALYKRHCPKDNNDGNRLHSAVTNCHQIECLRRSFTKLFFFHIYLAGRPGCLPKPSRPIFVPVCSKLLCKYATSTFRFLFFIFNSFSLLFYSLFLFNSLFRTFICFLLEKVEQLIPHSLCLQQLLQSPC